MDTDFFIFIREEQRESVFYFVNRVWDAIFSFILSA